MSRVLPVALVTLLRLFPSPVIAEGNPDSMAAHTSQAREAQQRGDFVTAAAEWQAIVALAPSVAEAHSNLGMMWHFAQQYPKAIPVFQKAIALNSKLVAPHLFLGIDYYLTSQARAAVPELRRTLTLEPDNALARKWLGMSYFQLGDFSRSTAALSAASRADPADLDLLFFLSRVCSKLLFQSYEAVKSLAPDSPYLLALRAAPGAVRDTTPSLSPEIGRLSAPLQGNKPEDALSGLLAFTQSNPDSVEGWYWLGRAGELVALKSLDAFLARSPESYRTHQLKAEYDRAAGDDAKASAEYREALLLKPDAVQIHLELGNIFMAQHDLAQAVAEYQAELRTDPYSLAALQRIGQAYADLHLPDRAEEFLTRALHIAPDDYDAARVLGKVQFERGDYAGAVRHYLAALKNSASPANAIRFQLSKAYRNLGDNVQADAWMTRFRRQLTLEHQKVQRDLSARSETPSVRATAP